MWAWWAFKKASIFFFSSTDKESPPQNMPRRKPMFSLSSWGMCSSASKMVGTPAMKLGFLRLSIWA